MYLEDEQLGIAILELNEFLKERLFPLLEAVTSRVADEKIEDTAVPGRIPMSTHGSNSQRFQTIYEMTNWVLFQTIKLAKDSGCNMALIEGEKPAGSATGAPSLSKKSKDELVAMLLTYFDQGAACMADSHRANAAIFAIFEGRNYDFCRFGPLVRSMAVGRILDESADGLSWNQLRGVPQEEWRETHISRAWLEIAKSVEVLDDVEIVSMCQEAIDKDFEDEQA